MPGEQLHQMGADGAQRAKTWLDSTTRTRSSWTNEDPVAASRLTFNWPHGKQTEFSFDVGGILFGEEFDNHLFVAEVKNYSTDSQGKHFDDFLAKAYCVLKNHSQVADQFMFLTWHPFRVTSWTRLTEADTVVAACLSNSERLLGEADAGKAQALLDDDVIDELCGRLWLIVLSEKQEELLISPRDRALIVTRRIEEGLQ